MHLYVLHQGVACSSLMLGRLGGITNDTIQRETGYDYSDFDGFKGELIKAVSAWDHLLTWGHPVKNYAHIVVSTSHKQALAEKMLAQFGFISSRSVEPKKSPGHSIAIWFLPVPDFLEKLGLAEETQP